MLLYYVIVPCIEVASGLPMNLNALCKRKRNQESSNALDEHMNAEDSAADRTVRSDVRSPNSLYSVYIMCILLSSSAAEFSFAA
jgi:hypothetical protein